MSSPIRNHEQLYSCQSLTLSSLALRGCPLRNYRICPACEEPDSIESIQHVLLHCPAYEQRRRDLRTALACLPAAQACPLVLLDDEGVITLLRDDFMGGTEEAAIAVDTFLRAIITYRNQSVEQFGG